VGWTQAATSSSREWTAPSPPREVTYDFERLMREDGKPVKLLKCSEFGEAVVRRM